MRTPEEEELKNIKKLGINVITPLDIEHYGILKISKKILRTLEKDTYLSIDMDVLDPAFAPGVTEPEPIGLTPTQVVYLCKQISKKGLFGFDVMELCPEYDLNNVTLHLAYRIILEIISSSK
jgi:agmatinase